MMDTITDLIAQFKAENTSKLDDVDKSRKPSIVLALEDFADDDRAIDFLLSVASDESEYDLARIEVFKIFEIHEFVGLNLRNRVGNVIREVLSNGKDNDVRNYAAMAAASYMDVNQVIEQIDRILHDKLEDSNLRWNAFAAIKANGSSPISIDSLRRLLSDNEFKQSAGRVLSEWNVN